MRESERQRERERERKTEREREKREINAHYSREEFLRARTLFRNSF